MVENMAKRCGELLQQLQVRQHQLQEHQARGEDIIRDILRLEGALTLMKEMGVQPPANLPRAPSDTVVDPVEANGVQPTNADGNPVPLIQVVQ